MACADVRVHLREFFVPAPVRPRAAAFHPWIIVGGMVFRIGSFSRLGLALGVLAVVFLPLTAEPPHFDRDFSLDAIAVCQS